MAEYQDPYIDDIDGEVAGSYDVQQLGEGRQRITLPNEEKLNEWIAKYKKIFVLEFIETGDLFIFRRVNRPEYRLIMTPGLNPFEQEEQICATCVLLPEDYDWPNCPDGCVPSSLTEQILVRSGLGQYSIRQH